MSSTPAAVVETPVANVPELPSPRLAVPIVKVAPTTSPPCPDPQEHVVPVGATGGATPEIQEVEESLGDRLFSGVGLLSEPVEGEARITNLMHSTWAAAREVDTLDDEDEEVVARHCLERGLGCAREHSTSSSSLRRW